MSTDTDSRNLKRTWKHVIIIMRERYGPVFQQQEFSLGDKQYSEPFIIALSKPRNSSRALRSVCSLAQ